MVILNRSVKNSLGASARTVRLQLGLRMQQVADIAGVSIDSVYQFEHGLPVYLDARRKILKALWAIKFACQNNLN